jgi:UDP-N-acetylglucosamine transferase subunit ALG13
MRVFFAVLNMGLGHATRSLPLIRALLARGDRVTLGGSGRSLQLLRQELGGVGFVELPDYNIEYTDRGADLGRLVARTPDLMRIVAAEHAVLAAHLVTEGADLVVSDHRYGCWSRKVPSWFLAHQLRFAAPPFFRPFEFVGALFNRGLHRRFSGGVLVPDLLEGEGGLLSGRLARPYGLARPSTAARYHYPGILSSLARRDGLDRDVDVFVSVSGPEPQRTVLERIVREQIRAVPGRRVVALGRPESDVVEEPEAGLTLHAHLDRRRMEEYMNRCRLLVARSGYSTVMEAVELGKPALWIPTPGQTEQVYLAERLRAKGWFHAVAQRDLDLARDVPRALECPGPGQPLRTADTVARVMDLLTLQEG